MMNDSGSTWSFVVMFFWFLILLVVVFVAYRLLRGQPGFGPSHSDPLDIAKERYAKGEITKEQYDQLRKDLRQ